MTTKKTDGRPRLYDWDKIFSCQNRTLVQGKDFLCAPHGMAQGIRNAAVKRRIKISLRIEGGGIYLTVGGKGRANGKRG